MPKKLTNFKLNLFALLIMSTSLNVILLMRIIPVDSTLVGGCSIGEKHLSIIGGDFQTMQNFKMRAEELRKSIVPENLPQGIAQGASLCNGQAYKLYVW